MHHPPVPTSPTRALAQADPAWGRSVEVFIAAAVRGLPPACSAPVLQLLRGGARVRARVALLGARASGVPDELAITVAAAAELLHVASLVHDDMLDGDSTRRGGPALHCTLGDGPALLVGHHLLGEALELGGQGLLAPYRRMVAAELDREASRTAGARERCGALFGWSCAEPARRDGRGGEVQVLVGELIGTLWQLRDDVCDGDLDPPLARAAADVLLSELSDTCMMLPVVPAREALLHLAATISSQLGPNGLP